MIYIESILIKVNFKSYEDRRDSLIGYPEYQPLCDTCEATGYDEYFQSLEATMNASKTTMELLNSL